MLPRFYAPSLDPAAAEVTLPPDEAAHLTRVLRLGEGDEVAVFDGRGVEVRARVARARRDAVTLAIVARVVPAAEPTVPLALAQAVLKADAMDDVVRDATMMGVARIDPIVSGHVVVRERVIASGRPLDRWRRIAVSSAKQCRRATVPAIAAPRPMADWLREARDAWRLILVEPSAATGREAGMRALLERPRPASIAVVVGPEGGWSAPERELAIAAGCVPVSLGALTLRADAMPIAALVALRFVVGDI